MRTLDRYIGTRFVQSFLVIVLILVSLFSFLELVAQLDDVGKGQYFLKDALLFVGLTLPRRMLDLVPVSTLLGSIIALGLLADKGELLGMQAAGLSVQRICWSVLATAGFVMLAAGVSSEYVVPPMEQSARTLRSQALSDQGILLTKPGFWARKGLSFIRVRNTVYGGIATDLDVYERDEQGRLRTFTHAREADIQSNKRWVLKDIRQKIIAEQTITTRDLPSLTLDLFLSPEQINLLELPADSLSPSELYRYVQALRARGQNADQYALAFWQKLAIPLTTGAMVLLSLPFVFGPLRERTAGQRIMVGSMVGIVFYLTDRIIGYLGLVLDLNPAFTALAPVAALVFVGLYLLRRVF